MCYVSKGGSFTLLSILRRIFPVFCFVPIGLRGPVLGIHFLFPSLLPAHLFLPSLPLPLLSTGFSVPGDYYDTNDQTSRRPMSHWGRRWSRGREEGRRYEGGREGGRGLREVKRRTKRRKDKKCTHRFVCRYEREHLVLCNSSPCFLLASSFL